MLSTALAEQGLLPESIVRFGIRRLLKKRLEAESARRRAPGSNREAWIEAMAAAPIALHTGAANQQHYEVPPAFFEAMLGKQLKYSSGYWPASVATLDAAEEAMLELTSARAQLADGQRVLELGCGWGSLTLWIARRFPRSTVVGVSNSAAQRKLIEARADKEGLTNVEIVTADMNVFEAQGRFDRIVSVEMFEHMRNWSRLLARLRRWIEADGRLFLHVFAHREYAYPFETSADDDWMGRNFFTGGMMPSADLIEHVGAPFAVDERWTVDGRHYARTAEAWLENLDRRRAEIERIFERDLGRARARVEVERWRIFVLACSELFGFHEGSEWVVSHARLAPEEDRGV